MQDFHTQDSTGNDAEGTRGHTSVTDIIGWHPEPVECSNGGFSHEPPPYTVDDLLAWLNDKLFHVWVEVYGDPAALPEAWDVYVNWKRVISYGDERNEHYNACAPTLLEAFERIVLAAAKASS